jgi:hypothetical protein
MLPSLIRKWLITGHGTNPSQDMDQRRKVVIIGILFSIFGLVTGTILSMSLVWGIVFILCLSLSIAFWKLKGGYKNGKPI